MPQTGAPVRIVDVNGDPVDLEGGGGGAATSTVEEQEAQTALLTTMDADTGSIATSTATAATNTGATATVLGTTADAVDLAGGATTVASKLRGLVQLAASILAKLPAVGTAGTASANVITVQGIASATAQPVSPPAYTAPVSGELAGSATAAQCPTITCKLVMFTALASNAGKVYLGAAGVTIPNGTTDTTSGIELAAGASTPWIPVDNMNRLYRICDNAGDDLTYLVMN